MKFELKTKTNRKNAKQYYFLDGVEVPRVTEVISQVTGKELLMWLSSKTPQEIKTIRHQALSTGSTIHDMLEKVLLGNFTEKMRETPFGDVLEAYDKWIKEYNVKPIKTEEYVYDRVGEHGYAGRTDAIVKIGKKVVLIDYKTSTSEGVYANYWIQLAAYANGFFTASGGIQVDEVWILVIEKVANEEGEIVEYKLHPYKKTAKQLEPYFQMFNCLLEYWYLNKKVSKK